MAETARTFPFHRFKGTHRQIGRQFGEACAELIQRHRDLVLLRLGAQSGLGPQPAQEKALWFRPPVLRYAPFFDEEIQGMAEGAGLSLAEAYLLQLRAESAAPIPAPAEPAVAEGCTSFAIRPEATREGTALVGQNDDLPAFYAEVGVLVEMVFDDLPAVLLFTAPGQVSHLGINDRGLGVFTNYLTSGGWRVAFPRSLVPRLMLARSTVDEAIAAARSVPRSTSRNLIMADAQGGAVDLETTPTRDARLDPEDGWVVHTNHYVADTLLGEEGSTGRRLLNSQRRLARARALMAANRSRLSVEAMQEILRDRAGVPDAISRAAGDEESDAMTAASLIAEPARGRMWVAVGPPHLNQHQVYEIGSSRSR